MNGARKIKNSFDDTVELSEEPVLSATEAAELSSDMDENQEPDERERSTAFNKKKRRKVVDMNAARLALQKDLFVDVRDLRVSFRTDEGLITPVDGVTFQIHKGRTLGIVGESGSGKSVSTRAMVRLLPKNALVDPNSSIDFYPNTKGSKETPINISALKKGSKAIRRIRGGDIGMIFQEPMASFSPVYTIGNQIVETIRHHRKSASSSVFNSKKMSRKEAKEIAVEMLDRVGISNAAMRFNQYPHELSGGMRQRAMIAVALSTHPKILIADEPTTALDVTIQAQIVALLKALQAELGMSIVFITHDMGLIANVADEIAVMYLGTIVEQGPVKQLIESPKHPYTRGLLSAIPRLDNLNRRLTPVGGDIPGPMERPKGCPFHPRCAQFQPNVCDGALPKRTEVEYTHFVNCFLYE